MKILSNQVISEKTIKEEIALYLATKYKDSFVCVIELSGRPIKTANRWVLIPFKSKFYRRGMSDISFLWNGMQFYFEVKTPEEYNWVYKKIPKLKAIGAKNQKEEHILEQLNFMLDAMKAGAHAGFVKSIKEVDEIINKALLDSKKME